MKMRSQQAQEVKQVRKKKVTPKKPHQQMKQKRKRTPLSKQARGNQNKQRIQEMGQKYFRTLHRHRLKKQEKIQENKALNKQKY